MLEHPSLFNAIIWFLNEKLQMSIFDKEQTSNAYIKKLNTKATQLAKSDSEDTVRKYHKSLALKESLFDKSFDIHKLSDEHRDIVLVSSFKYILEIMMCTTGWYKNNLDAEFNEVATYLFKQCSVVTPELKDALLQISNVDYGNNLILSNFDKILAGLINTDVTTFANAMNTFFETDRGYYIHSLVESEELYNYSTEHLAVVLKLTSRICSSLDYLNIDDFGGERSIASLVTKMAYMSMVVANKDSDTTAYLGCFYKGLLDYVSQINPSEREVGTLNMCTTILKNMLQTELPYNLDSIISAIDLTSSNTFEYWSSILNKSPANTNSVPDIEF